ncbi:Phosphoglycolate phosphatase [Maioricimonas rarisocia]|uniref:Phosphoglycolate phosphatase n=1 Tax=Maioricimonas rarisocia TaxID=2528026 RepID=A0A517Z5F2_9PLAN|nr:HAD hydrolase-like protein [Maioricimonas rarisocia]QDU37718.1 Phosphoglycolate phosphatase [Maioricimonas rarisocia]
MNYRMLLWDFDGTLADTLPGAVAVFNRLADRHGLTPITDPAAIRDMSTREFLAAHRVPIHRLPFLMAEFLSLQKSLLAGVRLHDGIPAALDQIRDLGCRLGVVSSNAEDNIRLCLDANGVTDRFEFIHGYSRLMGKERALRRAADRAGLSIGEILYVGDEVRDIDAAGSIGMDIAAVTWGFNSAATLRTAAPTYVIEHASELPGSVVEA